MMKKINILCPSQADIDDFTENYEATKGDLATCKNIFTRSKLRQAELKIEEMQKKDKWLVKSKEDVSDKAANVM